MSFHPLVSEALDVLCSGGPALFPQSEDREDLRKFSGDQELQEFLRKKDSKMSTFERLPPVLVLPLFQQELICNNVWDESCLLPQNLFIKT